MTDRTRYRPATLDQIVDVETPEQVVFSYTVAGVGTRAMAAVIDAIITGMIALLLVILMLFAIAPFGLAPARGERISEAWVLAILLIAQFAVVWGYHVLFEGLRDGQTPGKRAMGIRVVRDGGFSVTLGEAAIRNILRLVDMLPPITYAVGILSVVLTKSGKRLGDIVAGTLVVRERLLREQPSMPVGTDAEEVGVTASLAEPEYELLEQFLTRLQGLQPAARAELAARLSSRFAVHLPPGAGSPEAALAELYRTEQRARAAGLAARGDMGAARERHAIMREGSERWQRFAARLESAQRTRLRGMSEEQVSELVAEYRAVATDLARLRTASGGMPSDAVFHLSRLVAAGHNLLYHQPPISPRAVLHYLTVRVPGEIRRSARPILASALLLFGPMLITYRAVLMDPALAERILPEGMFDRADEGTARAREGGGYIVVSPEERPLLAAAVMTNNIQVTYMVFAAGITAGIGTVFVLVMNGISLGAAIGLYASMGIAPVILDFVIPHGVFELTAVCLAGGAGLLLARALLLPGVLDRKSALARQGKRAIDLVVAASLMLVLAGLIEGLISPRPDLPTAFRLGVAALSAAIIIGYIALGRRVPAGASPGSQSDERALISR